MSLVSKQNEFNFTSLSIMAPTFSPSSFIVFSMSAKFIPSTPLITGTTNPCEDEIRTQMKQNQQFIENCTF